MMTVSKQKLTLDQPATYQIKVPGELDENWSEYLRGLKITNETDRCGLLVSTLTGAMDQAALQGLLRHLYIHGLPLISVICVDYS